jgi:peptidoglycan/xylan/chitin deacetylase (PgdA/CDA1 family)
MNSESQLVELSESGRADGLPHVSRRLSLVRTIGARLFDLTGALRMWDRIANASAPRIVYYHNIHGAGEDVRWCREPSLTMPVDLFREQLDYLRRHFTIVTLDEIYRKPRSNYLALTFDDGNRGVYDHAFPVLRAWGLPATIFLVTSRLGSSQVLWWDRFLLGMEGVRRLHEAAMEGVLGSLNARWRKLVKSAPLGTVLESYKMATGYERRAVDGVVDAILPAHMQASTRIFLSTEEIRELVGHGVTIGAHTRTHPLLPWLDDQQLRQEIEGSRDDVLALTGQEQCWFAYPDGAFGEREENLVARLKFSGAVQTARHPERSGRYAIRRIGISPATITAADGRFSAWRLRWKLGGISRRRLRALLPV